MVVRIVKLSFHPERVAEFLTFFDSIKHLVNGFEGCKGMQLLQDQRDTSVIFTYSLWESEADLNRYRASKTFGSVWPQIKPWFNDKPAAWTTHSYFDGFSVSPQSHPES